MVVGVRHIHAVLYPFFVFTAVKLLPLVLGPGVRACSGIPDILIFLFRRTGRVARICGRSLGLTARRAAGDLLFLSPLLFQGRGQSNQNLVVIGTMFVPLAGRLVVCIHVYHIGDEGDVVES